MPEDRQSGPEIDPLAEAQAREQANRRVLAALAVIETDATPLFEEILQSARDLCHTPNVGLYLLSEDRTELRAYHDRGAAPDRRDRSTGALLSQPISMAKADSGLVQAVRQGKVLHAADTTETEFDWSLGVHEPSASAPVAIRSVLAVPLRCGVEGIGLIFACRHVVAPFTAEQIALVESFAQQAVMAIEKVRQFREVKARLEREKASAEILEIISRSRDDERPVFDAILANASHLCRAPLAFLSITDEARTHVTIPANLGARPDFAEALGSFHMPFGSSQLLAIRPIVEQRVIRQDDIADDELYRKGDPDRVNMVELEGARSAFAAPLIASGVGVGAIVLYRREVSPFTDDDVALVEAFAAQAVIAIENVRQFKALEARTAEVQAFNSVLETRVAEQVDQIERMGRLKRFLSPAVADAVVSSGDETVLGSHRALIATLFCDIRGFTAFCERAEPEETIEVLQTYHEAMGALIAQHGAGVDTRAGDGIMVIFNDPLPCEDPAGDALRLAFAMQARMAELCTGWKRLGHRLGFGVGISLGYATVGMVGSEGRYDYTASGTSVNLAARLCDHAGDGEILLSPRAFAAVEEIVQAEQVGALALKGIAEPVEVFRATGLK